MNLDDTLTLEQLSVSFSTDDGILPAVHAVSLSLPPAGITCLVGESGCGKSLTARAILHLLPENAHISGRILFRGRDLRTMPPEEMRALRGRHIAMIFQEPMTSLNPVLKVGMQTAEPLRLHLGLSRSEARQEVIRLFSEVGIPAAESRYDDYPHQLSGGMRQRVMIAMALACKPDLLLADEPTTALDATIQGQILSCTRGIWWNTLPRPSCSAILCIRIRAGSCAPHRDVRPWACSACPPSPAASPAWTTCPKAAPLPRAAMKPCRAALKAPLWPVARTATALPAGRCRPPLLLDREEILFRSAADGRSFL